MNVRPLGQGCVAEFGSAWDHNRLVFCVPHLCLAFSSSSSVHVLHHQNSLRGIYIVWRARSIRDLARKEAQREVSKVSFMG